MEVNGAAKWTNGDEIHGHLYLMWPMDKSLPPGAKAICGMEVLVFFPPPAGNAISFVSTKPFWPGFDQKICIKVYIGKNPCFLVSCLRSAHFAFTP